MPIAPSWPPCKLRMTGASCRASKSANCCTPSLAAGNAVIIKPSELTPLSTLLLAQSAFQGLPKGIVNVVTGYGGEVGEPLVTHRQTHVIAFTGSVATGKRIARLAAERVKK